jgi:hypothetical protein
MGNEWKGEREQSREQYEPRLHVDLLKVDAPIQLMATDGVKSLWHRMLSFRKVINAGRAPAHSRSIGGLILPMRLER